MQQLAREAGALLMSYFGKVSIEYKGEADLVTQADRASEKLIAERIRRQWPDHDLIGEEGSRNETGSDYRWYVDPLDGTTNFAHGYPVFCVSLGLDYKGERLAGVIYDPTRNEMFAAGKGKGATLNGASIHVSMTSRLAESLVATGFPSHKRHKNPNIHFYHQLTLRSHGVRRAGSAALDLCYVACGRYEAFWEFNLNPWDTAAGVLLVQEAGGTVTNFNGGPFTIDSRQVLASNSLLHDELLREFQNIFQGRVEGLPSVEEYLRAR
ncbi:MAG TPA: inositol monophosphatase family protein [Candidatus Limnocylindrales bacterium]|nr:inositol monophosphatase family protein [Candidatus Limnocylindrales bacterium]